MKLNNLVTSRLLKKYVYPQKKLFLLAFGAEILCALGTASLPYLLQPVFDEVLTKGNLDHLFFLSSAVFLSFLSKGVGGYFESILMTKIGQRLIANLQFDLFSHLIYLDLNFFHQTTTGSLLSKMTQDVQTMRHSLSTAVIGIGKDTITLFCLVAIMIYRDPLLSVIALFVFPLAVIPVLKLGRRMRSVAHHTQEEFAKLSHHLTQVFQGIRVVKAYNTQEFEKKRFKNYGEQIFKLISKATRVRSLTHPIIEIIAGIALVLVISYGGFTVMKGERTTGEFISFIAALLLVYEPIKRLSHLNSSIQEGIVCGKRILDLLDKKPHIKNTSESQIKKILGHIQFCDVSFSYQNSSFQNSESSPLAQDKNGRKALKGISFEIKQGSCVAFVGSSGSGKSTLINLIARFYDVSEGNILIDDVPIQDIDLFTLRSSISLVSQDVFLFHGTILENIAYGRFYKSNGIQDIESIVHYREKIISAAQKSYAHEFIEKLPLQYDSIIGENGVTLSGGQRQRLSLARALFKDAAIFLLDEATSALDTHSERLIQKAFFELMKTKTTVMVAHRLSTIIGSHCIYVLNHGKIVEEGTHESLLSQKGAYASLWHEQSS